MEVVVWHRVRLQRNIRWQLNKINLYVKYEIQVIRLDEICMYLVPKFAPVLNLYDFVDLNNKNNNLELFGHSLD